MILSQKLKNFVKAGLRMVGFKIERIDPLEESIPADYNRSPFLPRVYQGSLDRMLYFLDQLDDDASSPPVTESSLPPCRFKTRIVRNLVSQGGAAAKNRGIKAAQGDYLVFLDDDDLLAPGYIEDAITALQNHPDIQILFMHVQWFGERAEWGQSNHDRNVSLILQQTKHMQIAPGLTLFTEGLFAALLQRIPMPFQRPVLRRADFEAIGPYQEDCLLWDCEWALRAALYGPCTLLQKSPYLQRASGQGYSSQLQRQEEHLLSMLMAKERLIDHPLTQLHPKEILLGKIFIHSIIYS